MIPHGRVRVIDFSAPLTSQLNEASASASSPKQSLASIVPKPVSHQRPSSSRSREPSSSSNETSRTNSKSSESSELDLSDDLSEILESAMNLGAKIDRNRLATIQQFDSKKYFDHNKDLNILDPEHCDSVSINSKGQKLLANYYRNRYGANIIFPKDKQGLSYGMEISFFSEIATHIAPLRKNTCDFRCTFSLNGSSHAVPITYIKEGEREIILHANSLGLRNEEEGSNYAKYTDALGIPLLIVPDARQRDHYSCYSEAIIFGCAITAKNEEGNDFKIPGIINKLLSRSEKRNGYLAALLPDELLRTTQRSAFLKKHKEAESRLIHKNESLIDFHNRYTQSFKLKTKEYTNPKRLPHLDYLRQKGLKLEQTIEIQYYIEEIEKILENEVLNRPQKLQFILSAKNLLSRDDSHDDFPKIINK